MSLGLETLLGRLFVVAVLGIIGLPAVLADDWYRVESQDGMPVGTVREIWETGGPDLLVVEGQGGREHLLPAALVQEVDVEGRRAVIEVFPGLLDGD